MKANARTNQGGSVINFLIVGVILAAIALGVIFFAQQRGKESTEGPKAPTVASPSVSPSVAPSTQAPSSSLSPTSSPTPSPSVSPSPEPNFSQTGVMPETGPANDLLLSSLPIIAIMAAAVAYVQSRRATS